MLCSDFRVDRKNFTYPQLGSQAIAECEYFITIAEVHAGMQNIIEFPAACFKRSVCIYHFVGPKRKFVVSLENDIDQSNSKTLGTIRDIDQSHLHTFEMFC